MSVIPRKDRERELEKRVSKEKTVQDLSVKELLEDLEYYSKSTQMKCPLWLDKDFAILYKYIKELQLRNDKSKPINDTLLESQGFKEFLSIKENREVLQKAINKEIDD